MNKKKKIFIIAAAVAIFVCLFLSAQKLQVFCNNVTASGKNKSVNYKTASSLSKKGSANNKSDKNSSDAGSNKTNPSDSLKQSKTEDSSKNTSSNASGAETKKDASVSSNASSGPDKNSGGTQNAAAGSQSNTSSSGGQPVPKAPISISGGTPNFEVKNMMNGQTICSVHVDVNSCGISVAQVTKFVLSSKGIPYSTTEIPSTYFKSIAGLTEKASGHPLSGWCYYIGGVKPSMSSGSYSYDGKPILWCYFENALQGK